MCLTMIRSPIKSDRFGFIRTIFFLTILFDNVLSQDTNDVIGEITKVAVPRNPFAIVTKSGKEKSKSGSGSPLFNINLEDVRWDYVPRVKLTGIMSVNGNQVACITVEGTGAMIVKAGDRIVIPGKQGVTNTRSAWFLVHSIEDNRITIQLDDGSFVSGRLF